MKQTISFVAHPLTMFLVLGLVSILTIHQQLSDSCNDLYFDVMLTVITAYFFLGLSTIMNAISSISQKRMMSSYMELYELRTKSNDMQREMIEKLMEERSDK